MKSANLKVLNAVEAVGSRTASTFQIFGEGKPQGLKRESEPAAKESRSYSRKAEHSPYRRNPLAEIDTNRLPK